MTDPTGFEGAGANRDLAGHSASSVPISQTYFLPEAESSERRIAIFIFLLGCCYLSLFRRYTTMDPDEGIILQGAQRILNGQVVYRDFFSFLTPGSFYQTALLFRLFGDSILVARTALVVIGAAVSTITYLLARRVCSRMVAMSTGVLVIVATLPYRFVVLHNWDSTLWACMTTYAGLRWFETSRARWAFWTGAGCAITFLFEQSKGAGVCLGLAISVIPLILFSKLAQGWSRSTLGLLAGFVLPIIATVCFFAAHHALGAMLSDLAWPFRHYSAANRVFYGYQNWNDSTRTLLFGSGSYLVRFITVWSVSPCFLVPALPLIEIGLLAVWLTRLVRQPSPSNTAIYYVFLNSISTGLLISIIVVRADIVHFMYVLPVLILAIAWFFQGTDIALPSFKPIKPIVVNLLALAFLFFSASVLWRVLRPPAEVKTRRGAITTAQADGVVAYLQNDVPMNAKVLVYPYLPVYYYLTETEAPGAFDYFQPGMNTPDQAADIIQSLRENPTAPVLFEYGFASKIPSSWPATPISAIANDKVADFLLFSYRPCRIVRSATGARFLVMASKARACEPNRMH